MLCGLVKSFYDVIIKDVTIEVSYDPESGVSFSDFDESAGKIGNWLYRAAIESTIK